MDATIMAALIGAASSLIVTGLSTVGIEAYKHFKEGSAMAAALAGELSSYAMAHEIARPSLNGMVRVAGEEGCQLTIKKPPKHSDVVFEANVGRLGLLGVEVVGELVLVYHLTRAYRSTFDLACDAEQPTQVHLLNSALTLLESAYTRSGPLIKRLQERAGLSLIKAIWARVS